jgi:hypothetical protein
MDHNDQNENVELHDEKDDVVEMKHDLMNAEVQSVDSVAKTDDSVKQAPARRGDKRNGEKQAKTPATKIGAMYDKMKGLSKEDLDVAYSKFMGEDFLSEEESIDQQDFDVEVNADFTEDLDALVQSEGTLSEEFKEKTAVIFEAAIKSKVKEEVLRLEGEYESKLDEEIAATSEDLVEKVDSYLNYVVETWMKENEVAIEQGLRTEIAEEFMGNLKNLFTESYIEVPESKVDLVDELADTVDQLESKLDETTAAAISMAEELEGYQRDAIIREHAGDLADTQVEKLKSLAEDVDFDGEEAFNEKVKSIKEAYFGKKTVSAGNDINESTEEDDTPVRATSSMMDRYVTAIDKTNK